MGKIILDRHGDLRKGIFYAFHVSFDDSTDTLKPGPDWIVVPRTPTDNALRERGEDPWRYFNGFNDYEDRLETKNCPADENHVTHVTYRKFCAEAFGGTRVSPFVPQDHWLYFALSAELWRRLQPLKLRGAKLGPLDVRDHVTERKLNGFGAVQFVGRATLRLPKFMDSPNRCPHCGVGKVVCESCGYWYVSCCACQKQMATIPENHKGNDDKQLVIEEDLWRVLEGNTWDGSDLIQTSGGSRSFASKRFIDWLLRVHAAPFYAEPVWFCVDGMNDEQQKWYAELEKPLEA
jgi:hypothetical protein